MPPRDKSHEITAINIVSQDDRSLSFTEKLMKESQLKAKKHNEPKNLGIRRKTFHWELNLYTFGLLFAIYYSVSEWYTNLMAILAAFIALDATRYYYKKGDMPGVPYTLPMVSLVAMLIHPVRYWAELGTIAIESGEGICTSIMGGGFMIFTTDKTLCREILTGEGIYQVFAHPNALWLFGPKNLIYMPKEPHKAFRAILSPALFSKEALVQYAQAQESVCRRYLQKCADQCKATNQPVDVRLAFRSMAAASSQEAFLGPYLTEELRRHLEIDIVTFTMGFLSLPFPYFNSGLHRAIQAKERIEETIRNMVPQAHEYVKTGKEPRCLMERWCQAIQDVAKEQNVDVFDVPYCSDDNMARTVLDFLFAAQDATNSALAYSIDVLDEDRFVVNKLRNEIDNIETPIWTNMNDTSKFIPYTAKVSNQLLHHKPPVPMIPYMAKKDTVFAGRKITKGTVVIPSITYSARTSGGSIDFLPERPDQDTQFVKTVVFGGGQHKCPGRRYAESLLTVFLAVLAQDFDFYRIGERPGVDEFVYFPTLFPKDCDFVIKKRNE